MEKDWHRADLLTICLLTLILSRTTKQRDNFRRSRTEQTSSNSITEIFYSSEASSTFKPSIKEKKGSKIPGLVISQLIQKKRRKKVKGDNDRKVVKGQQEGRGVSYN